MAKQPRHDRGPSHPTAGRADRTDETREPAPYRRHPAARADPGFQRRYGFPGHPVPFFEAARPHRAATVGSSGQQEVETEFSNQIWQSDLLFGPYVQRAGAGPMEAFLYAILDDGSRLIPDAESYAQQGLDAFLDLDAVQLLDARHQ